MNVRKLAQLLKCGMAVLDRVNKSIFMSNITKITKRTKQATIMRVDVKNNMMNSEMAQRKTKEKFQEFARRWSGRGEAVFIHLTMVAKASRSIISLLDNTKRWGFTTEADFK